jgi:hypothetical protein
MAGLVKDIAESFIKMRVVFATTFTAKPEKDVSEKPMTD